MGLAEIGSVLAGAVGLVVSLAWIAALLRRRLTWVRVRGTVTSVKDRSGSDGKTETVVRYQYVDTEGTQHRGTDSAIFRRPRKGTEMDVRYDPYRPEISEPVSGDLGMSLLVAAGGVFALGLCAGGLGLL